VSYVNKYIFHVCNEARNERRALDPGARSKIEEICIFENDEVNKSKMRTHVI